MYLIPLCPLTVEKSSGGRGFSWNKKFFFLQYSHINRRSILYFSKRVGKFADKIDVQGPFQWELFFFGLYTRVAFVLYWHTYTLYFHYLLRIFGTYRLK